MSSKNNSNNNQNKPQIKPQQDKKPLTESTQKPHKVISNSNDKTNNRENNVKKSQTIQTASSLLQQIIDSNKK